MTADICERKVKFLSSITENIQKYSPIPQEKDYRNEVMPLTSNECFDDR